MKSSPKSFTKRKRSVVLRRRRMTMEALEPRLPLAVELVSAGLPALGGGTGNTYSLLPYHSDSVVSQDGRYVVFSTPSNNIVTGDNNGQSDVFRYDRLTQTNELVSVRLGGTQSGNNWSSEATVSADGRYVAFTSRATDLTALAASQSYADIFVRDMATHTTKLLSVNANGTRPSARSFTNPVISGNGSAVAFESSSYRVSSGFSSRFVPSQVFARRIADAAVIQVSASSSGAEGNDGSSVPVISADGSTVAFESKANNLTMTPDNNSRADIFARKLSQNSVVLVSATVSGASGN